MKKINIPIHKHTGVRYRPSIHCFAAETKYGLIGSYLKYSLVTDLQRVPNVKIYPVPEGCDVVPLSYGCFAFKKKLGFWRNLWQNKIKKLRRKV